MGDITCLSVGNGQFLYLATVLDLCSRRLTGWSITDHMRTCWSPTRSGPQRGPAAETVCGGAIFHSDNGAQYVSKEFARVCSKRGVTRSRDAVGTSADNAAAESLNATMKRETTRAASGGTGPARPASRSSAGPPATTPADATPASARSTPNRLRTMINYADQRRMTTDVHDHGEGPRRRHAMQADSSDEGTLHGCAVVGDEAIVCGVGVLGGKRVRRGPGVPRGIRERHRRYAR
ncbi:transposase [Streptomyces sp. NPDC088847]|uniref:transposase n=1 Tax=Streptomyces sp. NPDC088847 TaxID=3365909 RepID=UPI003830370C